MNYFDNLKSLREKFYRENSSSGIDKVVAASTSTKGIIQKPTQINRGTPKQSVPSMDDTESFMEFIGRMNKITKSVNDTISGTDQSAVDTSFQYQPKKQNQNEELGVKQLRKGETNTQPVTQEEQIKNIKSTSKFVKAAMPVDALGDTQFMNAVSRVARRFNVSDSDLLAVMHFETKGTFSPSITSKNSSATGLIQFLDKTAKSLGTTTEALAGMSRAEQMDYVEKYLAQFEDRIKGGGVEDLYMAVLNPSAIRKDATHVLFSRGSLEYERNMPLDTNNDGLITKDEASRPVKARTGLMERRI